MAKDALNTNTSGSGRVTSFDLQFRAKLENLWFKGEALQRSWISLGFRTETLSASKGLPVTSAAAKSKAPKSFLS